MGTRLNSESSFAPPLSFTQSSLRSRLKKLSKDLELATGQTLQLKAQLDQSEKKVGVLNSIVRSLRKELQGHSPFASLTKIPSNETLCSETFLTDARQGSASPSVQQQFEAQIRALQLQRDQEREKSQALELELFEILEVMEKSFHVNVVRFSILK